MILHKILGRVRRLYWQVSRPRTLGVRAIVVDDYGRVVLVRHTYDKFWYLPGGGVERKESIDRALGRELLEEIGIREFIVDRVLGVYHSTREYKDDYITVFVVKVLPSVASGVRIVDKIEIKEAEFFYVDQLPADISPATARRILEYKGSLVGTGSW